MPRSRLTLAALAVALAGCGGDDPGGGASGPTATVPAGGRLRVVAREYEFSPSKVVVTGDKPFKVTLENRGSLAHDLRIIRGGRDIGGVSPFQGGKPRTVAVRASPGEYQLICSVGNHEELGMTGTLQVR